MASKKRRLLALYLDFILFMSVWGLADHFITRQFAMPLWAAVAAFTVIRATTHKRLRSPGDMMLSIGRDGSVDARVHGQESWLTMLLGTLFVLEGTKQLVRWTQIPVPEPFFGFMPDSGVQALIDLAAGMLFIAVGWLIFKLQRSGLVLGIASAAGTIVSCLLSWSLWDATIAKMVVARRQAQGLPVGRHEIETMQAIMPEGIVLLTAVLLLMMAYAYRRFTVTADRTP